MHYAIHEINIKNAMSYLFNEIFNYFNRYD
ncbi:hypothetical protein L483_17240 [Pseudomonas putida H8234]|nr:hypothetical protein L483_17240 [Pseudomonas putida H8234]